MSCAVDCTVLCFGTTELEKASVLETSRALYSHTKPPASRGRYREGKVWRTKPQWPGVACEGRTRNGVSPHLVQKQWRVEGAELKNDVKILCSVCFLSFTELLGHQQLLTWWILCWVQLQCPSAECLFLTCPSHSCVFLGGTQTIWGQTLMP